MCYIFITLKGNGKYEITSYIFPQNFIAIGCNKTCVECNQCVACVRMNNNDPGKPLLHSEISFLQYITSTEDPARSSGEDSILKYLVHNGICF